MDEVHDAEAPSVEPTDAQQPVDQSALSAAQTIFLALCFWPTVVATGIGALAAKDLTGWDPVAARGFTFIILLLLFLFTGKAWRFLRNGRFRAGVVVGALGWFYGPVYAVGAAAMLLVGAECSDVDLDQALPEDSAQITSTPHNESFQSRGTRTPDFAGLLGRGDSVGDGFSKCVDTLYATHDVNSQIDATIRAMLDPELSVSSAQAIVYDVVVDVCMSHASSPKAHLGEYFGASLRNRKIRAWKEQRSFDSCSIDYRHLHDGVQVGDPTIVLDLRRAMCRLSEDDALILGLKAEGLSNREIGRRLDISTSLAGNKISEARDSLADLLGVEREKLR